MLVSYYVEQIKRIVNIMKEEEEVNIMKVYIEMNKLQVEFYPVIDRKQGSHEDYPNEI